MRKIPIEYGKEGDILGRTIYSNFGSKLLTEGSRLNEGIIKNLRKNGCFSIYIKDKYSEEEIEEIIKPETMKKVHGIQDNLKKIVIDFDSSNKVDIKNIDTNVRSIEEIVDEILYEIVFDKNIIEHLVNISIYDDYTVNHSLNVMMLSTVIAKHKGLNMPDIKNLALGCMLHDIGKTFIPIELINKPGILTKDEFEIVKSHSQKGYDFLRSYTDLPTPSINIALCHHEREGGSGYPRNLQGSEIPLFSKIASICDVFDALTSDRPYRRAVPVNEAMEHLLGAGGDEFSLETIRDFAGSINVFPKDTMVRLSDGREGIIHEANNQIHSRPKIKIVGEDNMEVTSYVLDLMTVTNIVIEEVIYKFSFQNFS